VNDICHSFSDSSLSICVRLGRVNNKGPGRFEPVVYLKSISKLSTIDI
jgi:hypothetical protein